MRVCMFPSLVVARSSLAPFDCTLHGDVWLMDAEPSIECGVPHGPNARMRPVAMLSIAWFVLGLPTTFSVFLWWNRDAVQEDQRLRERGEGDTALTNPHFQVRLILMDHGFVLRRSHWTIWVPLCGC